MWRSEGSAGDYEVLNLHIEDQHESLFSIPSHVFLGWTNPTGYFFSVLESKNKSLLFLGGSAALYFVGLASTPLEKEFCLNGLLLSSLSAATLRNIAEPTEVFLSILIYLSARLFLPVDLIFF